MVLFVLFTKITMFALFAYITLMPIHKASSILFGYILILSSFAIPLSSIKAPLKLHAKPSIFCIISIGFTMMVSYIDEPSYINMDIMKSITSFFSTYFLIAIEPQTMKKDDLRVLFKIGKLLSIVYVAYTLLPFTFRYTESNEWGATAFTMSMGNPNATAISVLFCIILLIGEIFDTEKRTIRLFNYILSALLVYTIYLLESRTVLICSIIVLAFPLYRRIRIQKKYIYISILIPILFIFLQLYLSKIDTITILGKPIASGRDEIYLSYLLQLQSDPSSYLIGKWGVHRFANYHNAPLAFLMNFGVLGLIFYFLFWLLELKSILRNHANTPINVLATIGIFVFFVHSSAEASPMMGSVLYGVEMAIICRLAKDRFV